MAHKTLFVYCQRDFDILKRTEPNAEVILITDPEKVRIHKLTEQLSIQYDFAKDKYRKQLELAANDIIVPGVYKILSIREENPREGFPQDLPKRFMATANWKPTDEEDFIPEFKVDVRLNPLLNKVSVSKIKSYFDLHKSWEAFNFISEIGLLRVKKIDIVDDIRYQNKETSGGVSTYQKSYYVEWEILMDPEKVYPDTILLARVLLKI